MNRDWNRDWNQSRQLVFLLLLLVDKLPRHGKCRHHFRLLSLNFPQHHQPSKVQESRVQCSVMRYSAVQYNIIQYSTVEYTALTVEHIQQQIVKGRGNST